MALLDSIDDVTEQRSRFLACVRDLSGDDLGKEVKTSEVVEKISLDKKATSLALQYLTGEDLISFSSFGKVRLTQKGLARASESGP